MLPILFEPENDTVKDLAFYKKKYETDDENLALRRAIGVKKDINDVAAILTLAPDVDILQAGLKSKKNAIDLAIENSAFDILFLLVEQKTQAKYFEQVIYKLNDILVIQRKNFTTDTQLIFYKEMVRIYQLANTKEIKLDEKALDVFLTASERLAEHYIKYKMPEQLFPHALTLRPHQHNLDITILQKKFEEIKADPNAAISYAVLLSKNPDMVYWIYENFLWRRLAPEKFCQFCESFFLIGPDVINTNHTTQNRIVAYQLLFYITLEDKFADNAIKLCKKNNPIKSHLEGCQIALKDIRINSQESYASKMFEVRAFRIFYGDMNQSAKKTNIQYDSVKCNNILVAIKNKKPLLALLNDINSNSLLSCECVLAIFKYINVSCSNKLALRENLVKKIPVIVFLLNYFKRHFLAFEPLQQVFCFREIAKFPLVYSTYTNEIIEIMNCMLPNIFNSYSAESQLGLIATLIKFKFSTDVFEKNWRFTYALISNLNLVVENKPLKFQVDFTAMLIALTITLASQSIFIPTDISLSLLKAIDLVNKAIVNFPKNLLYSIYLISNYLQRANHEKQINKDLMQRTTDYINSLTFDPIVSPLQEIFEIFLRQAACEFQAEAVINGLPVDFFLPQHKLIIQIDGRKHYNFSDEGSEPVALDFLHDFQLGGVGLIHFNHNGDISFTPSTTRVIHLHYTQIQEMSSKSYEEQYPYWQKILGREVLPELTKVEENQSSMNMMRK